MVKQLAFILICGLSCGIIFAGNNKTIFGTIKTEVSGDTVAKDSDQYELLVFDPTFETYLLMQPPVEFFPEIYYKDWNSRYVAEWNYRYFGMTCSDLYENYIDYNQETNYGLQLEYRLYYFFRYFEIQNHIVLVQR